MPDARVLLLGTGGIAEVCHLPAVMALPGEAHVVGAVDLNAEAARAFAQRWSIPYSGTDLHAALAELRPDLVIIATPPADHHPSTLAALRAGAWVWCEKPPAVSLAEYDEMMAAQRAGGPYAAIVFQQRFGAAGEHARRLIAAGELGEPFVALCQTTWYRPDSYYEVPWRGDWATEGGGPALGLGIHQIDLLLELLGDWTEVRAMIARLARDVRTDDLSTALVRFHSGAIATVVNSVLSPRQVSYLRVDLRDATVELSHLYGYDNDAWTYTPAPHVDPDSERVRAWRTPPDQHPSGHTAQLRSLLASWRAGQVPRASGVDGRRSLELITAMYKAGLTGATVHSGEIVPGDPFYAHLHGDVPGWAPA